MIDVKDIRLIVSLHRDLLYLFISLSMLNIGGLKVKVPIIQGGMGVGISLSGLAGAVANQGGVGVISSAGLGLLYPSSSNNFNESNIRGLALEIKKARAITKGIIGVNIMVAMTNYAELARAAVKEKIDIIFSGAGLPVDLPAFLEEGSKTRLVPIVSSARAARILCEKWKNHYNYLPDAIVVEGPKAGGHLGFKRDQIENNEYSLEELIPQVVNEVREFELKYSKQIPVIAAGGIYTGTDMYNIMNKGASAVQLGTRFVTTDECDASDKFKQTYINAERSQIDIIQSPVGMPGRAILNGFTEKIRLGLKTPIKCPFKCIKTCDVDHSPYCIITALFNAAKGNMRSGYAFAGTNAYLATRIETVKEVFQDLTKDYNRQTRLKTL